MALSEKMSANELREEIEKAKARNPVGARNREDKEESIYDTGAAGKRPIVEEINRMAQTRKPSLGSGSGSAPEGSGNDSAGNTPSRTQQTEENAYARYLRQAEEAAAAQREAEEAARREQYNLSRTNVNTAADEALRQAYIRKRQQMAQMPQQNALMGNGGLSETAMMQLEADYGNNRAALEAQRLEQLGNLEMQLNEGLAIDTGNYYNRLQQIQKQRAEQDAARELAMMNAANTSASISGNPTPVSSYSQTSSLYNSGVAGAPYGGGYVADDRDNAENIIASADQNVIWNMDNVLRRYGNKNAAGVQDFIAKLYSRGMIDDATIDAWDATR